MTDKLKIRTVLAELQGITTCDSWELLEVGIVGGVYRKNCSHENCVASAYWPPNPFESATDKESLLNWVSQDDTLLISTLKEIWKLSGNRIDEWHGRDDMRAKIFISTPKEIFVLALASVLKIN